MPARPRTLPIVLAGFTAFLDLYATQPLLPLLVDVFGASHFDVSLTVTVATVAVALAAPVVGRLGRSHRPQTRHRRCRPSCWPAQPRPPRPPQTLPQFLFWRFVQGLATPASSRPRSPTSTTSGRRRTSDARPRRTSAARSPAGSAAARWSASSRRSGAGRRRSSCLALVNLAAAFALAAGLPRERPRPSSERDGHRQSLVRLLRNRQLDRHRCHRFVRAVHPGRDVHLRHVPPERAAVPPEHGGARLAVRCLSGRRGRHAGRRALDRRPRPSRRARVRRGVSASPGRS